MANGRVCRREKYRPASTCTARSRTPATGHRASHRSCVAFDQEDQASILRAAEYLRDLVLREVFTLKHIPGVDNPADVMTKALPRGTFLKVVDLITHLPASIIGLCDMLEVR